MVTFPAPFPLGYRSRYSAQTEKVPLQEERTTSNAMDCWAWRIVGGSPFDIGPAVPELQTLAGG